MRDEFETQPIDLLLPDGTITPGELQHWEQGKDVWVTLICGDVRLRPPVPNSSLPCVIFDFIWKQTTCC